MKLPRPSPFGLGKLVAMMVTVVTIGTCLYSAAYIITRGVKAAWYGP